MMREGCAKVFGVGQRRERGTEVTELTGHDACILSTATTHPLATKFGTASKESRCEELVGTSPVGAFLPTAATACCARQKSHLALGDLGSEVAVVAVVDREEAGRARLELGVCVVGRM